FERDAASAAAEYGGEFRSDLEAFVPLEVVEACVGDFVERAPGAAKRCHAFVDPSGGSADSFTLAISSSEGDKVVVDCIREVKPPFSPEGVVEDFAVLLKSYGVHMVKGDKYAGEWPPVVERPGLIADRISLSAFALTSSEYQNADSSAITPT